MLAFGGLNSGIFKALLVLHILSAIVGLGTVMLNGLYAAQAQAPSSSGARSYGSRSRCSSWHWAYHTAS